MESKRILIAVDGSPAADAAVEVGLQLAGDTGSSVRFIHASSPLAEELAEEWPEDGPPSAEILARDQVLADAVSSARDAGVEAEVGLISSEADLGDLAAVITGVAAGIDAQLIVVGSRGRGALTGAVLGSVSHALLKYSSVPVVTVHSKAGSHDGNGIPVAAGSAR
jgi:nucleotide-binding universal stress UspA family protein